MSLKEKSQKKLFCCVPDDERCFLVGVGVGVVGVGVGVGVVTARLYQRDFRRKKWGAKKEYSMYKYVCM